MEPDDDQALPIDANGVVLAGGIASDDETQVLPILINPENGGVVISLGS